MIFTIVKGDLLPVLKLSVKDAEGAALDLTSASGATFKAKSLGDTAPTTISRAATMTDAAAGEVEITWVSGDTAVAGIYECQLEISYSGGRKMTVPAHDTFQIEITEKI